MKLIWLDLNSSYAHSSLALAAIHAQTAGDEGDVEWGRVSATINSNVGGVVAEVVAAEPDVLAATAWLFTHEVLLKIVERVKALLPRCVVILGGPEMLGDNEAYLRAHSCVDCVFRGEGERGFHDWLRVWRLPERWGAVAGLCWIDAAGAYHDGGMARVEDFAALEPPERSRFFDWSKPFVQLETTRGCFNTCAFCVSGAEKPVRALPVERVGERLRVIREHGIREVRLLDRTFNGSSRRAVELLALFREFAGEIRFHLEIHPALLSGEVRRLLGEMPPGLLHLEAGIQSLREDVLRACGRLGGLEASLEGLRFLASLPAVVVHADLIAGLPLYAYPQMVDDVRALASFGVDEIQLELLKLLPGTPMRRDAAAWGIVYSPGPPYEVLRTPQMGVDDLRRARLLSRLVDGFYNAEAWRRVTRRLVAASPDFLPAFLAWLEEREALEQPLGLEKRGALLYEFCAGRFPAFLDEITVAWVLAGIPLAKEPGGGVRPWSGALPVGLEALLGEPSPGMRFYHLRGAAADYWFGFDRARSASRPLYAAWLRRAPSH